MVFLSKKSCFRKDKQWRQLSYGAWPRVRYVGPTNGSEGAPAFIFKKLLFWRWMKKLPQKRWCQPDYMASRHKESRVRSHRCENYTSHRIYKCITNYKRIASRCLWEMWVLLALQRGFVVKGKASHIPRSFHDDWAWWGTVGLFQSGERGDISAQLWNCQSQLYVRTDMGCNPDACWKTRHASQLPAAAEHRRFLGCSAINWI